MFQNNKTNISISIMLVIELGSWYLELKFGMMKTQRIEMDENRSVLVWDWNLPVSFRSVPVPFLHALGTEVVPFGKGSSGLVRIDSGRDSQFEEMVQELEQKKETTATKKHNQHN